jgi:hypothetical protein
MGREVPGRLDGTPPPGAARNLRGRRWAAVVVIGTLLAFPEVSQAQGGGLPTEEGAPFLLLPTGARGVGMGRAMTALPSAEAGWWNPAGLARLEGGRALLTRGEHITGDALGVSIVTRVRGLGVVGGSYQLLDQGTLDATDGEGNVVGSLTIRNHLALVSYALPLWRWLDVGANLKYLRFELGCRGQCPEGRVRSSSYALDLGARGQPLPGRPLDLGVSLVHVGPEFRNEEAGIGAPLPARPRAGFAWEPWSTFIEEERLAVLLALDVEDRFREPGDPAVMVGAEFSAGTEDRIYIRGGYTLLRATGVEGGAAGFGVRYDRFELDLARALPSGVIASQQEPVHLTLGIRF